MVEGILIGFAAGSGAPVRMELHHTVVSGVTQKSGKTTTIKALVGRSGMKAIVFLTKRGEIGFHGLNTVQPYYREQTGWQYVKSVMEASQKRKMNFEEAWIIKACDGAKGLRDVLENTRRLHDRDRRDFNKDQYRKLIEYLKIIVPQVEKYRWARSLPLERGINVMDLVDMPFEMQSLVIQSTLAYIMDRMRGVIAVIPEAWKFVPKSNNPVKLSAEGFVRQGAAIGNYLWVDTQDLRGVDTAIIGQCNNWLMGFQRELNEAERVAKTAGKKVNVGMIQGLRLGHFVACLGVEDPVTVYVWPEGVPMQMAIDVAVGALRPEDVKRRLEELAKKRGDVDDLVYKEKYEESQRKLDEVQAELDALKSQQPAASGEEVAKLEEGVNRLIEQNRAHEERAKKMGEDMMQLDAENEALKKETVSQNLALDGYHERVKGLEAAERLANALRDLVGASPQQITQQAAAPVDVSQIVDQVAARFRAAPEVRVVTVNVDEAAKAALLDQEYRGILDAAAKLSDKAKLLALSIRERGEMRAIDFYYLMSGKSTGRPSGDFYPNLTTLKDAHLIENQKGQIRWFLPEYLRGRFPWVTEEQAKQLADNVSALLLPKEP